ncbi:ATP-binding protein [Agrobacterium sp. a22-2]|uniref:ATP-binding protein n=1 Tax=Agrobacterium sp. a22-2 TaxID=2283840 RepID=UPI001446607A|nr:ATP-binding protein [Agrobacterium sp. a22-2]NKN37419.1 ATP-binding protein [Agrobacterium sp. a22-2]
MHHRKAQRDALLRKLTAGINVQMPAPRRIGKTWTINRLAGDLTAAGWIAVEVDVQGIRTTDSFARILCKRIEAQMPSKERFKTHLLQRLKNLTDGHWGDNPLDVLGKIDPIEFAETLVAALDDDGRPAAIIIDEVAYFFLHLAEQNAKDANAFAYQMRAMQGRYKNVRWLLTGSIGLDPVARRYGLQGAFVDLETFILDPFTAAEARSFLRDGAIQEALTHKFDASDEDFDYLFQELGWLAPFYLKLVANAVRPSGYAQTNGNAIAGRQDFDDAFTTLLQPNRRSEFAIWREHIDKNLPASDSRLASEILSRISQDSDGETFDTLLASLATNAEPKSRGELRDIIAILVNDGLVSKVDDRYRFRSGLVRRYWKEYEA